MPVKRPDQLPEGEDFNFEDILMVEKSPDSNERKLYKTKLREFMESALKMDPERIGSNAVLGLQSKFEWLIEQMDKISQSPVLDIAPVRLTTTNNDTRSNYKTGFINQSGTTTINGLTVQQRQSLTDALKPKADD